MIPAEKSPTEPIHHDISSHISVQPASNVNFSSDSLPKVDFSSPEETSDPISSANSSCNSSNNTTDISNSAYPQVKTPIKFTEAETDIAMDDEEENISNISPNSQSSSVGISSRNKRLVSDMDFSPRPQSNASTGAAFQQSSTGVSTRIRPNDQQTPHSHLNSTISSAMPPVSEKLSDDEDISMPYDELEIDLSNDPIKIVSRKERVSYIKHQSASIRPAVGDVLYLVSAAWVESFANFSTDDFAETFGNLDIVNHSSRQLFSAELSKYLPLPKPAWDNLVKWYRPEGKDGFDYFSLPRKVTGIEPLQFDYFPLTVYTKIFTRISLSISPNTKIVISESSLGSDFYYTVFQLYSLPSNTLFEQIRIWGVVNTPDTLRIMKQDTPLAQLPFKAMSSNLHAIDLDSNKKISDSNLNMFSFIIIEFKEINDKASPWPSEQIKPPLPPRRNLPPPYTLDVPKNDSISEKTKQEDNDEDEDDEEVDSEEEDEDEDDDNKKVSENPVTAPPPPPPSRPKNAQTYSYRNTYTVPIGTMGLNNLGNTCYMNSALQCLTHVPELVNYFLSGYFKREINRTNPIGYNGKIAEAFGDLLMHLFGEERSGSSYACRPFKTTVGRLNSAFAGYQQQDTQEFLSYLLDGLHEDLNRVLKKPLTEKPDLKKHGSHSPEEIAELAEECWRLHKLRNDSVILDLFVGLYKSTLVCPTCHLTSITFDPFMDLTLPLPSNEYWCKDMLVFPKNGRPIRLAVELDPSATMCHLRKFIADNTGVDPRALHFADILDKHIYKNIKDGNVNDQITSYDTIYVYEADAPLDRDSKINEEEKVQKDQEEEVEETEKEEEDDIHFVIPVYLFISSEGQSRKAPFPYYITLTKSDAENPSIIIQKILTKLAQYSNSELFDVAIDQISSGSLSWKSVIDVFTPHICYNSKYNRDIPYTGEPTDTRCTFLERVEEISTNVSLGARMLEQQKQEEERQRQEYANYNNYQQTNIQPDNDSLGDGLPAYEEAVNDFAGDDYTSQFTKNSPPDLPNRDDYSPIENSNTNDELSSNQADNGEESESSFDGNSDSVSRLPANSSSSNLQYADRMTPEDSIINSDPTSSYDEDITFSKSKNFQSSSYKGGLPGGNGNDEEFEKTPSEESAQENGDFDALNLSTLPDSDTSSASSLSFSGPLENSNANNHAVTIVNGDHASGDDHYGSSFSPPSPISSRKNYHNAPRYQPSRIHRNYQNNKYGYSNIYSRFSPRVPDFIRDAYFDPDNKLIVSPSALIAIEIEQSRYDSLFDETNLPSLFIDIVSPDIIKRRAAREAMRVKGATLDDCLDQFYKTEVLGEDDLWYCTNCQGFKRASKTLELWKTPDVFIIHLKRFSSWREKINDTIKFPITGLDMSRRIIETKTNSKFLETPPKTIPIDEEDKSLMYDLFAVDNHFGSVHGGHYTAYVKNFADNKWYYFDDSRVTEANPEEAISGSAYLLFYRRRGSSPLGGEHMNEIFTTIEAEREANTDSNSSLDAHVDSTEDDKRLLAKRFPGVGRSLGGGSGSLGSSVVSNFGSSLCGTGSEFSSTSELPSSAEEGTHMVSNTQFESDFIGDGSGNSSSSSSINSSVSNDNVRGAVDGHQDSLNKTSFSGELGPAATSTRNVSRDRRGSNSRIIGDSSPKDVKALAKIDINTENPTSHDVELDLEENNIDEDGDDNNSLYDDAGFQNLVDGYHSTRRLERPPVMAIEVLKPDQLLPKASAGSQEVSQGLKQSTEESLDYAKHSLPSPASED